MAYGSTIVQNLESNVSPEIIKFMRQKIVYELLVPLWYVMYLSKFLFIIMYYFTFEL